MKGKILIPILCSIVIGFFFGKVFFNEYNNNTLTTFNEGEKMYFIQKNNPYSNLNKLKESNSDYKDYLYLFDDNKYYFYVGITKSEKIAKIIKEFYEKKGNKIYIREIYVDNYTFSTLLNEYDKLSSITSTESLTKLQKVIISNYKEMVQNGESTN